jgi:hypothetical protein
MMGNLNAHAERTQRQTLSVMMMTVDNKRMAAGAAAMPEKETICPPRLSDR